VSRLTHIRGALKELLKDFGKVEWSVVTGATEFGEGPTPDRQVFSIFGIVGPRCDGTELILDNLLDSSGSASVKAALERDRHLGGLVMDLRVVKASGAMQFPRPGKKEPDVGAEWKVEVLLVD
jgi:hypothetical protein